MRNATSIEAPSLFEPLLNPDLEKPEKLDHQEKNSDRIARDFVRWCWSFGNDFRNSPDITNFRSWQHKTNVKLSAVEEDEILVEARRLFLKKVEQAVRKADAAKETD